MSSIYSNLLPQEILNLSVQERKVNCSSCYRSSFQYKGPYPYKSTLKCCTFHPYLPNYLVGGILLDSRLEIAQKILQNSIPKKIVALPIGLLPPLAYQKRFQSKSKEDFGQKKILLCPYYNKDLNNCSIWPYRGAVCTAFFCQSSYGLAGKQFWKSYRDYLSYVEMAMQEEVLIQRGFSPRQVSEQLEFINYDFKESELHKKGAHEMDQWIKNLWYGYESHDLFYIQAYKIAKKVKPKVLEELMGELGERLKAQVLKSSNHLI